MCGGGGDDGDGDDRKRPRKRCANDDERKKGRQLINGRSRKVCMKVNVKKKTVQL